MMWSVWWVWLAGALILGVLEVFVSGYILLGFAIGAAITGILLGIGGPLATLMAGSLPATMLIFAVLSLIAWALLRKVVGVRDGQVKVWDRDINED
ncbi:NfeD family protein [Ovoidimarina sediminis]|uniref:NfeD family protein n=1 Tax=Ovoidimarina sediminis TaxID=3079856 RepID=UPI00290DFE54|nr:hypothetical protein [Rhodophyticola sp. MJ-SS7]MDU8943872.1 hypothetical protein [Rhodophyticola sp. MJ-SS7]